MVELEGGSMPWTRKITTEQYTDRGFEKYNKKKEWTERNEKNI